jgi:membrane-bound serine protease (ClpP class)
MVGSQDKRTALRVCLLMVCVVLLLGGFSASQTPASARPANLQQDDAPLVLVLTAEGPLTPAMAEYLRRGLRSAQNQDAELLVFQLNTPGGSLDLMNDMIQTIRLSPIPVVVYVAPRGAMAGSAGALITLAAHASAMAPETSIGAASPVDAEGKDLGETMAAKEKNILRATVRSLAVQRSPEAVDLAEQMIESARAVSAGEALQIGLIDFVAADLDGLLRQLDGFVVQTIQGEITLETRDAQVSFVPTSFIEQALAILTNPNIIFLLITIGVQAILIEISSPGGWVAGTVGVICLALALYGLGVLNVNWFGAVFLLLAFALFILDIKAPTHGALTAAAVASLIVSGLVFFNSPSLPAFQPRVNIWLVVAVSLFSGGIFFVVLLFAVRAQKTPVRVGAPAYLGRVGQALTDITPDSPGLVRLASEEWTAELLGGEAPIAKGERVQVARLDGLRLIVKRPN